MSKPGFVVSIMCTAGFEVSEKYVGEQVELILETATSASVHRHCTPTSPTPIAGGMEDVLALMAAERLLAAAHAEIAAKLEAVIAEQKDAIAPIREIVN